MDTLSHHPVPCSECHGTGVKPCRSADEIHMSELATFCSCGHGQLRWAATLQRLHRTDKQAPVNGKRHSISMDSEGDAR